MKNSKTVYYEKDRQKLIEKKKKGCKSIYSHIKKTFCLNMIFTAINTVLIYLITKYTILLFCKSVLLINFAA